METRYVMQDGADFYVFDRPESEIDFDSEEGRSVESIWTFSEPVSDYDREAAERARAWFLESVAAGWIHVVWE